MSSQHPDAAREGDGGAQGAAMEQAKASSGSAGRGARRSAVPVEGCGGDDAWAAEARSLVEVRDKAQTAAGDGPSRPSRRSALTLDAQGRRSGRQTRRSQQQARAGADTGGHGQARAAVRRAAGGGWWNAGMRLRVAES